MKTLLLVFMLILGFGCNKPTKVESFVEVASQYMNTLTPGTTVALVKEQTARGGEWIVVSVSDGNDLTRYAFNIETFDPETMTRADHFIAWLLGTGGTANEQVEPYETSDGNIIPGYYVGANNYLYETTQATSKDLEKMRAVEDLIRVNQVANSLSSQFGFSQDRSLEVASFVSNFNKIAQSRSLTREDYNAFSEELMGIDYDSLQQALSGDDDAQDDLIHAAASRNQVNPEAIRALINESL